MTPEETAGQSSLSSGTSGLPCLLSPLCSSGVPASSSINSISCHLLTVHMLFLLVVIPLPLSFSSLSFWPSLIPLPVSMIRSLSKKTSCCAMPLLSELFTHPAGFYASSHNHLNLISLPCLGKIFEFRDLA